MASESELERRVAELEISVAHQQRLCEQLNEVLTQQTKQLLQFEKTFPQLALKVQELKLALHELTPAPKNEKPPHY